MASGAGPLSILVLGSGTSTGVPTIGCRCEVCTSADPRDRRLRPSVLIRWGRDNILVDTTPDLRYQALRAGIEHLEAVLFTHGHADHILGLDDVRPFNYGRKGKIPIYGSPETLAVVRRCFSYVFDSGEHESSVPRVEMFPFGDEPFEVLGHRVAPVKLAHGRGVSYGFRFGAAAYLTDHSDIPEESLARLEGLDVLFLDGLRYKPHPTHTTVERAVSYAERLKPRRTFLTHICHDLLHARDEALLPPWVRLAYDGLEIQVEARP